MPTTSWYVRANNAAVGTFEGAPFGAFFGAEGSKPGLIFSDGSDATYGEVLGDGGEGQALSLLFNAQYPVTTPAPGSVKGVPLNSTGVEVEFFYRVRVSSLSGCSDTEHTVEVWAGSGGQRQLATAEITDTFTWYSTPVPTPGADPSVPWTPPQDGSDFRYGLRARGLCGTGVQKGAWWSEGRVDVTFVLPAPVMTLLTPPSLAAHSVQLSAVVNPNQTTGEDVPLPSYPLDLGFTWGTNPAALPSPTYFVFSYSGDPTTDFTLISTPITVTPGTTYFFKAVARDQDGNVTLSDTFSTFTTPLRDPIKGIF